jgi:hypothetical protein
MGNQVMRSIQATIVVIPLLLVARGANADFTAGQEAYSIGDYETAVAEWQPLAAQGHAAAQYGMGLLYANGFGVEWSNEDALKWYTAAAEQGHADAIYNIGVMYANGWGVPQSDDEAFRRYTAAAELGVTDAQTSLAKMHARGIGTERNYAEAYKWYTIAAELGDAGAPFKQEEMAGKLSAEEKAASDALAASWLEEHPTLQADH